MPVSKKPRRKKQPLFSGQIDTNSFKSMWTNMLMLHMGAKTEANTTALKNLAAVAAQVGRKTGDDKLVERARTVRAVLERDDLDWIIRYPLIAGLGRYFSLKKRPQSAIREATNEVASSEDVERFLL